ncbi:MAG: TSUP family transporter [Candidatus Pacearchaeota archaeon]|nr:TSUP family transporter [Candidatus Pacearchaeota archaeon]
MEVVSLVFLLAGFATGIITGLVGASAIVVFVPIILLFLSYSLFALIGVSLAVDVFVSLLAMIIYRKFHHIDFKTGFYLVIPAVLGAVLGSYLSKFVAGTDLLWLIYFS